MNLNAQRCKFNGGRVVFGYYIDENKNYIIDPIQSEWVKKIFEMYTNRVIVANICRMLNNNDVKTSAGNEWTDDQVRRVLSNEKILVILGKRIYSLQVDYHVLFQIIYLIWLNKYLI